MSLLSETQIDSIKRKLKQIRTEDLSHMDTECMYKNHPDGVPVRSGGQEMYGVAVVVRSGIFVRLLRRTSDKAWYPPYNLTLPHHDYRKVDSIEDVMPAIDRLFVAVEEGNLAI